MIGLFGVKTMKFSNCECVQETCHYNNQFIKIDSQRFISLIFPSKEDLIVHEDKMYYKKTRSGKRYLGAGSIFFTSFADNPRFNQVSFQDPATPAMLGIIDLHHEIMF